ncbi:hypothetical protein O181_040934 [Austropuccinia psidii MF-1]|uniref:Uncharacterized protein n=1 Tax=Austropuccinia psidii MF-1 TaxID=1389203 RepID=A0A9Q3HG10_9BASI|nr:hypothetical protein [Austropuccinia psidii MF-1]
MKRVVCTCQSCALDKCTSTQPNGPIFGQYISICNKHKHEHNDLILSQENSSITLHKKMRSSSTSSSHDSTIGTNTDSTCDSENEQVGLSENVEHSPPAPPYVCTKLLKFPPCL